MMKSLRTQLLSAVLCSLTSLAFAQSTPNDNAASATSTAREGSIAISVAVNGKASAEAEDGAEALATAIRQAVINDPRLAPTAKKNPETERPVAPENTGNSDRESPAAGAAANSTCKPQYVVALQLADGRVAYIRLTRDQLLRLIALKANQASASKETAPRRIAACH